MQKYFTFLLTSSSETANFLSEIQFNWASRLLLKVAAIIKMNYYDYHISMIQPSTEGGIELPSFDKIKHLQQSQTKLLFQDPGRLNEATRLLKPRPAPKNFKCDLQSCSEKFKTKFSLKRHYKKHFTKKELACSFCTKRFNLLQYLQEHEHTHSGAKPYGCS